MSNNILNNNPNNFDDKKAFKILSSVAILICIFIVLFNAWVGPSLAPLHREYEKILDVNLKNNSSSRTNSTNRLGISEAKFSINSHGNTNTAFQDYMGTSYEYDQYDDYYYDDYVDFDDYNEFDEDSDYESDEYPDDIFVNINEADADELMMIPYVGQVLANRIIAYRETYGPFESIDELLNIEGIGEKRLATIASYIYLE